MKIIAIILRILMGILFICGSIVVLFNLVPQPQLNGDVKIFMDGMVASRYLMPLLKITELLCGIAFLTGYFVPLALIVIAPVVVNIFFFQLFLDIASLPIGIFLVISNIFLAYMNWEKYKQLFNPK